MGSETTDPFDRAAEDRFRGELLAAGFEIVEAPRRWARPLPDGLTALAHATHLEVEIVDGFPVTAPRIYAPGANLGHVDASGQICLWRPSDQTGQWASVDGILARLREFDSRATAGFAEEDLLLDAHMSFSDRVDQVAVLEVEPLAPAAGPGTETDPIALRGRETNAALEIEVGRPRANHSMEGRAYRLQRTKRDPPRDVPAIRAALGKRHLTNFDRLLERVATDRATRFAVFTWPTDGGPNVLVILLRHDGSGVVAYAAECAPTDAAYLAERSGPEHSELRDKAVIMFGVGAIGSHVAHAVSACGVSMLHLVDPDVVRPSNAPRLAASDRHVIGLPKGFVTSVIINSKLQWTKAKWTPRVPPGPIAIKKAIDGADLVIDATGEEQVARALELVSSELGIPIVTGALYRSGAVARVRRVCPGRDTALDARTEADGYPVIPIGPTPPPEALEPGCTSPVNNASPVACLAAAALLADVAIDTLADTGRYPDEVIDVYRPIEAPFDAVGRFRA